MTAAGRAAAGAGTAAASGQHSDGRNHSHGRSRTWRVVPHPHLSPPPGGDGIERAPFARRADARHAVATGLRRRRANPKCVTQSSSGVLNFALDARGRLTRAQGFVADLRSSKMILCQHADSSPGVLCHFTNHCQAEMVPGASAGPASLPVRSMQDESTVGLVMACLEVL